MTERYVFEVWEDPDGVYYAKLIEPVKELNHNVMVKSDEYRAPGATPLAAIEKIAAYLYGTNPELK